MSFALLSSPYVVRDASGTVLVEPTLEALRVQLEKEVAASLALDAEIEQVLDSLRDYLYIEPGSGIPFSYVYAAIIRSMGNKLAGCTVRDLEDRIWKLMSRSDKFIFFRKSGWHYKAEWEKVQRENAERKEAARLAAKLKAEQEEYDAFLSWKEMVRGERERDGFDEVAG